MKPSLIASLILMLAFCIVADAQTVAVTPKKVVYKRPKPIGDYKKSFTVTYPKVKAATPAISRKIESSISYERSLGVIIAEEINETQWLEEASYEVIYNKDGILNVALTIEGSGAYPSGATEYVVVSSKTGLLQMPATMFTNTGALAAMINGDLKKEIEKAIIEIKADKENGESDPESLFEGRTFEIADFDGVSVDAKGITFHYDYGFPHVVLALQPPGKFTYSWAEMKKFLKPGGLLAHFAR